MKTTVLIVLVAVLSAPLGAQDLKPVPKDSVRVFIPGCTKGLVFTAGPRTEDQPGRSDIPEGMHLRMNGPKKLMAEIKAYKNSMIEITGLVLKGQVRPGGVNVGGLRITPGLTPTGGGVGSDPFLNQVVIDVEGWRPVPGGCPSR